MYGHIETALDRTRHLALIRSIQKEDVLRMYAISRLMLDQWIVNVQAAWVKQGPGLARACLQAGANDFGGTLMNDSISASADAPHGQFLHPTEMRAWIRSAGRTPVERSTTYRNLRVFDQEPAEPEAPWTEAAFGSYAKLIASSEFRFRERSGPSGTPSGH